MAFNLGTIGAAITLDDSGYVKTLGSLEEKTNAVLKKVGSIALSLFGFRELAKYAKNAVDAFIVQDNAVNSLGRSLQAIGQGSYKKKLQEVAKSLQDVTTYGDEATLQVMNLGLNMGISAEKMETATKAAMGLAAKYKDKLDLSTAMQLIAKAAQGNTSRLKMFGIQIDETKSKTEQLNELLKKGEDAFPLAKAQTFGQHLIQLQNAWGDLSEQVGEFIVTLFDLDNVTKGATKNVNTMVEWMKDNLDALAYEIQYVYRVLEAGIKSAYALVEPVLTYIYRSVKDLVNNIIALSQWGIENADKVWGVLPDLFWAHLQDVYASFKKTFEMVLDLGVNFVKALWQTIRHGSADGFRELWAELQADFVDAVSAGMENKVKVLMDAGFTEIPDMQKTAFISDVIDMYKQVPDKIEKYTREMEQKQAQDLNNYYKRLQKKRANDPDGKGRGYADPAAETKNNVAGSFQASVLSAMLGAGKPEQETAKNTRKMVELQRETNTKLDKKEKYV